MPVLQGKEICCLIWETADLFSPLISFDNTQAYHEKPRMRINACTSGIHHFYKLASFLSSTTGLAGVCLFSIFSGLSHLLEQTWPQGFGSTRYLSTVQMHIL